MYFVLSTIGIQRELLPYHTTSLLFPYTTLFRSPASGNRSSRKQRRTSPTMPLHHVRLERFRLIEQASLELAAGTKDRKSTRLNSSHVKISYAVFCLKKKTASTAVIIPSRPLSAC